MAEMKNRKKIISYKKYQGLNIGTVLFGILFLYMMVCMFLYLTSSHIAPYEVISGTLSGDYQYTALALKTEVVVPAPESGSVTYYAREGEQIGVNGAVCSIDESGPVQETETSETESAENGETETLTAQETDHFMENMSKEDMQKIQTTIATYSAGFSEQDFQRAYEMKADVESTVLDILSDVGEYSDNTLTENSVQSLCRADEAGIVIYSTDGFEQVQPEQVTADMFDMKNYNRDNLRLQATAKRGEPLYKMITAETWSLIIPVDGSLASELTDQSVIKIRFLKDSTTENALVTIFSNDGGYFAKLDLDYSVIRFASDRFVDIELLLNRKKGLKIPKSAIAEKSFYVVPEEYVIFDEDNPNEIRMLKQSYDNEGKVSTKYITATVYKKEENQYFVDFDLFSEGDYILKENSSNTYRIENTEILQGVYNINKGYAVFREITVIADNEEYCIVEEGATFGLSQYDHIALDANAVSDDQIL